jgi:hypothetical protein
MANYQKRLIKEITERGLRLTAADYAALWKRNQYDVNQAAIHLKVAGMITIDTKGVLRMKEGIGGA